MSGPRVAPYLQLEHFIRWPWMQMNIWKLWMLVLVGLSISCALTPTKDPMLCSDVKVMRHHISFCLWRGRYIFLGLSQDSGAAAKGYLQCWPTCLPECLIVMSKQCQCPGKMDDGSRWVKSRIRFSDYKLSSFECLQARAQDERPSKPASI